MKHLSTTVLFFTIISLTALNGFAQQKPREELLTELQAKRAELQSLENQLLAPSLEDSSAYAAFLSQPDTGLIRLLPRERYDNEAYRKNNQTITLRGGGAYYSFSRLTHEYGYGSDIELDSGYLSVGFAGADYGMLVNLGDLALEQTTLEHPSLRFLSTYEPPTNEPKARLEAQQFGKGFTADQIRYQRRLPVEVKSTYLLRSIEYSTSDVLVALKIVRQDADGSVIILWKLLKKYPVPQLAHN
jgi:hypothetical protein